MACLLKAGCAKLGNSLSIHLNCKHPWIDGECGPYLHKSRILAVLVPAAHAGEMIYFDFEELYSDGDD
jgi:hypothetical protein